MRRVGKCGETCECCENVFFFFFLIGCVVVRRCHVWDGGFDVTWSVSRIVSCRVSEKFRRKMVSRVENGEASWPQSPVRWTSVRVGVKKFRRVGAVRAFLWVGRNFLETSRWEGISTGREKFYSKFREKRICPCFKGYSILFSQVVASRTVTDEVQSGNYLVASFLDETIVWDVVDNSARFSIRYTSDGWENLAYKMTSLAKQQVEGMFVESEGS